MVFPLCPPGYQPSAGDIGTLGMQLFDHFIYTASERQKEMSFNGLDPEDKIGRDIYILDDLQTVPGNDCEVTAGAISQLTMGSTLDSSAKRV